MAPATSVPETAEPIDPARVLASYPEHAPTLWSMLASRAAVAADREFLVFEGRSYSYADVLRDAECAARMYAQHGIRAGDRVAVMSRNHPSTVVSWLALCRLGAILVPVNPEARMEDARHVFENAGVSAVLLAPELAPLVTAAVQGLARRPWLLLNEPGQAPLDNFEHALSNAAPAEIPAGDAADATCVLIYTSGTTGLPKGVKHSQRTVVLSGEAFVSRMHLVPNDRLLCILPLFHVNGLFYSLAGSLAAGATLVLLRQFSASTFWTTVAALRVTEVNLIAAVTSILMRRPRDEYRAGHGLKKIYGAPLDAQTIQAFQDDFCVPVLIEGYGMSEVPGVLSVPWHGPHKPGSMGIPSRHPYADVRLADVMLFGEDGRVVPHGEVGELAVRTPLVMQGYFGDESKTAESFRGDWFMTGDLARQDPDGYFWFVARRKDIIRRRGENVSGAEIDRVICSHPDVEQAAAIGVPSALGEEEILVAIMVRPGRTLSAADVKAWMESRLAGWKVPRYVVFLATLPHTPTFRVAKHVLRDMRLLERAIDLESVTARP